MATLVVELCYLEAFKWTHSTYYQLFFFFSYQLFKLKLSTYLTDLPTNYSITLQDILYATG